VKTTFTETQISERHRERVATLVDLYGDTLSIPRDIINRLQARNREDWQQYVEERDGKRKAHDWRLPMPEPTAEQVAAVEPPAESSYGSDEPDAQTIADAEDAEQTLAEEATA
jgi:hypothetical protein